MRHTALMLVALIAAPAHAQGLSPMREDFATYSDRFVIRLRARNPYPTAQHFEVRVFEEDGAPSAARAIVPTLTIAPYETVAFLVAGETDAREARALRVCVRSAPFANGRGRTVRGEACGAYRILQRRL